VVHVTSGANIYPLPAAVPDPSISSSVLTNGTPAPSLNQSNVSWGNSTTTTPSPGSDEALGGALLTPIPWLRNLSNASDMEIEGELQTSSTETIDGPNGAGHIETVTVSVNGIPSTSPSTLPSTTATSSPSTSSADTGNTPNDSSSLRAEGGITQGELLRQEQRAGVVPASQLAQHPHGHHLDEEGHDEEDVPHARGPEEIGMEDMGPQNAASDEKIGAGVRMRGIDVEAAVGRKVEGGDDTIVEDAKEETEYVEGQTPKRGADEDIGGDEKRVKDRPDGKEKEDEDIALVDVDGKEEGESKVGEDKDMTNVGADAADSTTQ
jgi:hypothetical protein